MSPRHCLAAPHTGAHITLSRTCRGLPQSPGLSLCGLLRLRTLPVACRCPGLPRCQVPPPVLELTLPWASVAPGSWPVPFLRDQHLELVSSGWLVFVVVLDGVVHFPLTHLEWKSTSYVLLAFLEVKIRWVTIDLFTHQRFPSTCPQKSGFRFMVHFANLPVRCAPLK